VKTQNEKEKARWI